MSSHSPRLLANRYRLVDLIGTGAMGQVYRAQDTLLGNVTVAVKFLSQTLLNQRMRERFEQEATISALLGEKSIHVVRVKDYGVDEHKVPFYVMELLTGESLDDVLELRPLALPRFFKLARQIGLGLQSAHQGIIFEEQLCPIVHRDIKPSNIFVIQDPSLGELVKILDFGIAKLIQDNDAQTHSFMGTLAYCSPEQIEGQELDSRSDIYSFGVMMYEMLTNEMPLLPETSSFGGWYKAHREYEPHPFAKEINLPSELEELIMQCLAKTPDARPQSVTEILSVLEKLEKGGSVQQPSPAAQPRQQGDKDETCTFVPSADEICFYTAWPKDKPQQKIVFPYLVHMPRQRIVTLCVMLEHQEILQRMPCTRYNQFLFTKSPHPMLLWISVLYHREYGPRWLPCYLDMKSNLGQEAVRALAQSGDYKILLFALGEPQRPKNILASTVAPRMCDRLQDWANASQIVPPNVPQLSKKLLKQEYQKLKPQILLKLKSVYTRSSLIS
ncbi:MAG: serine/threonine protein kinase [Cyanophyceae cyanobacterium]